MKSILVYDWSLRIFHWGFAGSLTAALVLGLAVGEHSPWFSWHIFFGIAAGFFLLLRLVLGVVGSRYSRFARMPVGLSKAMAYARGLFAGGAARHAGHNPGSAWAALAMFAAVPALLVTGLWAGRDPWEDMHGFLAYALLAVIGLHLAGLAWHTIQHRENIAVAMITGRKIGRPEDAIASARPAWALVMVVAATAWIGELFINQRAATTSVRLPLTNFSVPLGEGEEGKPSEKSRSEHQRKSRGDH
jgi:cytochrome b